MPKLLVENLATAFGLDPNHLTPSQHLKLAILIDWTLELSGKKSSKIFSSIPELTNDEYEKLLHALVSAEKAGIFADFSKPKPELIDLFYNLGNVLGIDNDKMDSISTLNLSGYIQILSKNKQAYSENLEYPFNEEKLNEASKRFKADFHSLKVKPSIAETEIGFDYDSSQRSIKVKNPKSLEIVNISQTKKGYQIQQPADIAEPTEIATFFLRHLIDMTQLVKAVGYDKISEQDFKIIQPQLKVLIETIEKEQENLVKLSIIKTLLESLHESLRPDKNPKEREAIAKILSSLIYKHPEFRPDWITVDESTKKPIAIDRVILVGPHDIANQEVLKSVNLAQRKHQKNEKIAIAFSEQQVREVNNHNNRLGKPPFTLQVIGHGSVSNDKLEINSNLGPFRGKAVDTGKRVAELVNQCPLIEHLRLTGCYTGKLADEKNITKQGMEKQVNKFGLNRFILKTKQNLADREPFLLQSAAMSCWNAIEKENRNISITVSPGPIEPSHEHFNTGAEGKLEKTEVEKTKEITVTTPGGKKAGPKI